MANSGFDFYKLKKNGKIIQENYLKYLQNMKD